MGPHSSFEVHVPVGRSASADYLALILGFVPDFPLCLGQMPGFGFSSGIFLPPASGFLELRLERATALTGC